MVFYTQNPKIGCYPQPILGPLADWPPKKGARSKLLAPKKCPNLGHFLGKSNGSAWFCWFQAPQTGPPKKGPFSRKLVQFGGPIWEIQRGSGVFGQKWTPDWPPKKGVSLGKIGPFGAMVRPPSRGPKRPPAWGKAFLALGPIFCKVACPKSFLGGGPAFCRFWPFCLCGAK